MSHKMFYQTVFCVTIGLTCIEAFLSRDFLIVPFWSSSGASVSNNAEDITEVEVVPIQIDHETFQERAHPTSKYQKTDRYDVTRSNKEERINRMTDSGNVERNDKVVGEPVDVSNQGEREN